MTSLPRVIVLATGGTIAGTAATSGSSARYQSATVPVNTLLEAVPALRSVARVEGEQVAQVDSKDMTFALWTGLVARIAHWTRQPDVAGIVVTHGTDTLEETAMLLHLVCAPGTPVVLTAAMRPSTSLSADGPQNLLDAVRVAAHPAATGRGVLVVLNQEIHAARDVVKAHTSAVNAFASPQSGPIGMVQDELVRFHRTVRPVAAPWPMPARWPAIEIVTSYVEPGRTMVDALVGAGVRGLVVAAAGNGSIHENLLDALAGAARAGVAVVRSSRTGAGFVTEPAALRPTAGAFVSAGDLNPYKARVVLAVALALDPSLAYDAGRLQRHFTEA